METVFSNEHLTIKIDKQKSITYYDWTIDTERINDDLFFSYCEKILQTVVSNKSKKVHW